jgi:hypothetical protein
MYRLLAITLLLLALVPGLRAAEAQRLYEATVPVAGQTAEERQAVLGEALRAVAVKVTGQRGVAGDPALTPVLEAAETYIQQYRYDSAGEGAEPALRLRVRFDPAGVEGALRAAGLPVWGRERPQTLMWVVVDDGRSRALVSESEPPAAAAAINDQARARALPMLLPLLDLEDRNAVSASDVWGRFQEVILAGSERYGADAVVAGRAYRTREGGWRGDWNLFAGGAVASTWESRGGTLAAVLAEAVDRSADTLAGQVVPSMTTTAGGSPPAGGAQIGGQRMTVIGLERYEDYGRLLRTLESLPVVKSVQVSGAGPERLELRLELLGSRMDLERAVGLERMLVPEAGMAASEDGGLTYRWMR